MRHNQIRNQQIDSSILFTRYAKFLFAALCLLNVDPGTRIQLGLRKCAPQFR
jgi:hypothetical protein